MKPSLLITESVAENKLADLEKSVQVTFAPELWKKTDHLLEVIPTFDALLVRNQTQVTENLIQAAKKLKVVGRAGAGLDNINVEAASRHGVVVTYAPTQNTSAVAEFTMGLIFALSRWISFADKDTKKGGWKRAVFTGVEIEGKVLGIVGLGRIGFLVAQKAHALGMRIVVYDPFAQNLSERTKTLDAEAMDLEALLTRSDYVSCHVPETALTRHLFNRLRFSEMKRGAYFINASRGGVVDENALLDALTEGSLAGAALDVREAEPPTADRLAQLDNVILTPHIAAFTKEAQERVEEDVLKDVLAVLGGGDPVYGANSPASPRATTTESPN
jgi:D-3-phosphoglycerate dehydrogenase / 2-oxoglutarate reductase